ncbi:MAG: phosphatase PAP2 family protein [Minisyncoccia bacterium]
MVTYYFYEYFKNTPAFFYLLDIIRDFFLAVIILTIFGYILISGFRKKKVDLLLTIEVLSAIFLSFFLCFLIKTIYPEIRPISYFIPYYEQLFDSFPSRHMTILTSIAFVILYNSLEFGILLLALDLLMGVLSWVSLQHWPIDIFTGWFLGFLIAIFVIEFIKYLLRSYRKKRKG